jgi:glutamate synthase (NADPH/NADH) large chain
MHFTDSGRARHILENWDDYLPKFVKVMPVDYRRALLEMQARTETNGARSVHVAVGD